MSKTKISEYSSTANSNTDVGGINIDEGCAPSGINDAIRTLMAQLKNFQTGTGGDSFNGPVGSTTPAAGAFTTLAASSTVTLSGGTANGVAYLNGSKVVTSGSALVFDGTNLGLGVSPSAWGSSYKAMEFLYSGCGVFNTGSQKYISMIANAYRDSGGTYKYAASLEAGQYAIFGNQHIWYNAASGTAGNAISFTQAMTLDASGNLSLGVGQIAIPDTKYYLFGAGYGGITGNGSNSSSGYLAFATFNAERARIDSSGHFLMGTTDPSTAAGVGFKINADSSVPNVGQVVNTAGVANTYHFYNTNATNSGYRFYVGVNGGVNNFSGNNVNLSDERTKTNIEVSGGYLDKICDIPVKLFNYKDEPEGEQRTLGVIAQDVEAVAPELVNQDGWLGDAPEGEAPLKSIYTTDMMFALMKCIQEQQAIITSLTARIEALEA